MQEFLRNLLIYVLCYECCAFFCELCDFSWIVRSDAIWGRLCEIAPMRNIRRPVSWLFQMPIHPSSSSWNCITYLKVTICPYQTVLNSAFLLLELASQACQFAKKMQQFVGALSWKSLAFFWRVIHVFHPQSTLIWRHCIASPSKCPVWLCPKVSVQKHFGQISHEIVLACWVTM